MIVAAAVKSNNAPLHTLSLFHSALLLLKYSRFLCWLRAERARAREHKRMHNCQATKPKKKRVTTGKRNRIEEKLIMENNVKGASLLVDNVIYNVGFRCKTTICGFRSRSDSRLQLERNWTVVSKAEEEVKKREKRTSKITSRGNRRN